MLARDLGGKTRQQMLDEISARELTWWRALYVVESVEREAQQQKKK